MVPGDHRIFCEVVLKTPHTESNPIGSGQALPRLYLPHHRYRDPFPLVLPIKRKLNRSSTFPSSKMDGNHPTSSKHTLTILRGLSTLMLTDREASRDPTSRAKHGAGSGRRVLPAGHHG